MAETGTPTRYRVMHHIGGFPHKEGTAGIDQAILGGVDNLQIITLDDLPEGIDTKRLIDVGALRKATSEEIEAFEELGQEGARTLGTGTAPAFTTGNDTARGAGERGSKEGQGTPRTGTGMTKGELSENTVADLRVMAKEQGIEGAASMNKAELLDALTAPPEGTE
jgi:hypothetical protein